MSLIVAQNDFTRKIKDFDTSQKLPKNVGDLCKLIVATGFEKLPKGCRSQCVVLIFCKWC